MSEAAVSNPEEKKTPTELKSRIIGKAGKIPNPEELAQATVEGDGDFLVAIEGEDCSFMAFDPRKIDEPTARRLQQAGQLLTPTVQLMAADFRQRTGAAGELRGMVTWEHGTVEPPTDNAAYIPHTDVNLERTKPFHIAFVGVPTLIFEGDFDIDPNFKPLSSEQLANYAKQIEDKQVKPTPLESGDIVAIDGQTLHQSPAIDPWVVGTNRTFIRVILGEVKPDAQP